MRKIAIILALLGWLFYAPLTAAQTNEKPTQDFSNYQEPDNWVMDRSWGDEKLAYENWQKSKPKPKAKVYTQLNKPTAYNPCSCVSYARYRSGINVGPIGVARNHPVNSHSPSLGAILITYESKAGHASYVVDFDDKFVYVDEANYSSCRVTYRRAIPLTSKLIKGYYK